MPDTTTFQARLDAFEIAMVAVLRALPNDGRRSALAGIERAAASLGSREQYPVLSALHELRKKLADK